jgi:hypothetical protein
VLDLDEFKAAKKEYDRKRYARIQRDREALLLARKQERSRIWHEDAREHNGSQWSELVQLGEIMNYWKFRSKETP